MRSFRVLRKWPPMVIRRAKTLNCKLFFSIYNHSSVYFVTSILRVPVCRGTVETTRLSVPQLIS